LNELIRAKSRQARARILAVVADLTDEQLAWRPSPRAHSIGFTLWHTARADDNVQADLTGAALEWDAGEYAKRWGHPERGVGTGWDDERAASLPLPPKQELFDYVKRVFDRVDAAVDAVDDASVERAVRSRFMGAESTMGEIVVVCMSHDNRHLGEMEYIKGLLGLRGTATS
jgi:uncharacterized damage-inducible protein DinB